MMFNPPSSLLFLLYILLAASNSVVAKSTHIKFLGGIDGRSDYEFALLHLAISKNNDTYGDARLSILNEQLGATRGRREVEHGQKVNVLAAPVTNEIYSNHKKVIIIPIAILNGLLGYRSIAVRQGDIEKYRAIAEDKNEQAFKALVAGQGRAWFDIDIYKENGYKVIGIGHFDGLFQLLHRKRFDYLPLGVIEMRHVFSLFSHKFPDVVEVRNLMLHYPLPVFFQVSAKQPELAARLEEGLRISKQDGSFTKLLKQFYSNEIKQVTDPTTTVFHLKNPFLPPSLQGNEIQDLR